MKMGKDTNYLVVNIITDTSQTRALGARQVEAVSSARYRARVFVLGGNSPYPACPSSIVCDRRAAAAARSDLVPRCTGLGWKGEEEPLSAPPRNQTSTAAADSLVLARALPCLAARFSVHLLWTARILLHTGPSAVHTTVTTRQLLLLYLGYCAPRPLYRYGAVAGCFAQAKALRTSITQDYIRPSAANLPPDRSPHTALARVSCHVLGCTCRQLLPPPLLFFLLSFFLCSILAPSSPHSALAELTPSIHVLFSSPRHKPPPSHPSFFFSSSLVSSSWPFVCRFCLFPRLARPTSSSLQLQAPPHLHQQGPKEPFQGSVERDACEISCYCHY